MFQKNKKEKNKPGACGSKITRAKRIGGVAQVVGCLPGKHEALPNLAYTTTLLF
jgi:hypothetical protein